MPGRWIIRRDLKGAAQSEALRCVIPDDVLGEPWVRSIEQCVADLLKSDERCVGVDDYRLIYRADQLVGHIEVTDKWPGK